MSVRLTPNVVLPGWIMIFGMGCLSAPPQSVAVSLSLLLAGVFVIPAIVLINAAHPAWSRGLAYAFVRR